jgi:hypothetical protein
VGGSRVGLLVGVGESLAGGPYVTGLFVAATGSAAAAIDVVALESQTAADVRTDHIANDAASDDTNRRQNYLYSKYAAGAAIAYATRVIRDTTPNEAGASSC